MFGSLFAYPKVLARHQAGPVAEERDRYLVHRAREGIARATLRRVAAELLIVARWIDLSHGKRVTLQDIDAAARRWADHQQRRCRADSGRDNYLLGSQLLGYAFLDGWQIYRTKSQTPLQTTPRILLRTCWMNAVCRSRLSAIGSGISSVFFNRFVEDAARSRK